MSFEKKCLVSPSDLDALIQKHEQSLSENSIITKAAQEVAKGEAILNYNLPDGLKATLVRDLRQKVDTWTQKARYPSVWRTMKSMI